MQDTDSEIRTFYTEIYAKIEMQQSNFPNGELGADLAKKIRTKIHCNRETMSLVEIKVNEYEGEINRDNEED